VSTLPELHRTSPRSYFPLSRPEQPSHRVQPPPRSAPSSPGLLSAARAPVRPEPSSPHSPLCFAPPPPSFGAPERPEAKLRSARRRAHCPRRRRSTVDRARPAGPRRRGPGPRSYPLEINSLFGLFGNFAKRPLDFCEINPRSRFCRFCTQTPRVFRN
jgi:hypothetical protein